jgi:hypothetical protein
MSFIQSHKQRNAYCLSDIDDKWQFVILAVTIFLSVAPRKKKQRQHMCGKNTDVMKTNRIHENSRRKINKS